MKSILKNLIFINIDIFIYLKLTQNSKSRSNRMKTVSDLTLTERATLSNHIKYYILR